MRLDKLLNNITGLLNKQKQSLLNMSLYFAASLIQMAVAIGLNPFLALNLTHEDYSIIGYYNSFQSLILPLFSLYFFSFYSRKYFKTDINERKYLRQSLVSIQLIISFIELFFVLLGFYFYYKIAELSTPFYPYAILTFSTIILKNILSFWLVELKLSKQVKKYFNINLANIAIGVLTATIFVIIFKLGALGRMFGFFIGALVMSIIVLPKLVTKIKFDKEIFREAMLFCWPLMLGAMLNYFFSGIDKLLLERKGDTYNFGLYNVAFQITNYLTVFISAVGQTFEPDIYQSIIEKKKRKLFKIIATITVFQIVPVIIFILFSKQIMMILTFNRYTEATQFAKILSLRVVASGIYFSLVNVLIGFGFPKITLINKVIGTFFSVFVYFYLIENFSFIGAAWGQSISFLIMIIISSISLVFLMRKSNF